MSDQVFIDNSSELRMVVLKSSTHDHTTDLNNQHFVWFKQILLELGDGSNVALDGAQG